MQFVFQPLTWAFFLVLVPLLIHLINMMRHKRVQWAAMEFLLASYKKHRKWIWLKQLMLLLMRMAAVAAAVAIMAQLVPPDKWASLFGGRVTHHYVLLDDSYSMSDRASGKSAYDQAEQVVRQIVERAASQDTAQKLTLIRFTRAAKAGEGSSEMVADISAETIDDGAFKDSFEAWRSSHDVTQLSVGPAPAMEVLAGLLGEEANETRIAYVVSDFRARDWENPAQMDEQLNRLQSSGAEIHLVNCIKTQRPNLGITFLAATEGTRSAGVPLFVQVSVKNFGPGRAENVKLNVVSHLYEKFELARHGDDPAGIKAEALEQPTEVIKEIEPGETVTRRVQVYFPTAGKHVVEARLPEDAIAEDNVRLAVVDFPDGEEVLLIDGHPDRRHAYFLAATFQPQSTVAGQLGVSNDVRTGILPKIEDAAKLRDLSLEDLQKYRAIYILDVPRLDDSAIEKLEAYANDGGGVAFFLGDHVNATHYNEKLYRDGAGIFPLALDTKELLSLQVDEEDRVPDFEVEEHPVLSVFAGDAVFRRSVLISTFFKAPAGWSPPEDSSIKVLATLRDKEQSPLVVEKQLGEGRVVAFTTTLAPLWNNWARGASFVVTTLQLHGYIAAPLRVDPSKSVGDKIEVQLDRKKFQSDVKCIVPALTPTGRKPIAKTAMPAEPQGDEAADLLSVSLGRGGEVDAVGETDRTGIYEIWSVETSAAGQLTVERYALNVEPDEGDLQRVTQSELNSKLKTPLRFHEADEIEYQLAGQRAGNWSEYILYALILLLLGEQLLAYSASYHRAPGGTR